MGPSKRPLYNLSGSCNYGILELISEAELLAIVPGCSLGEFISGLWMKDWRCAHRVQASRCSRTRSRNCSRVNGSTVPEFTSSKRF